MAGNPADSSISGQVVLLVAGIVLGSLVGFLSEIAKEQYAQLESRHVVRVNALPEETVDCDQSWESPPAPVGRPSQCKKIGFSLVREGVGSVPSLDITVSLKSHESAIVSTKTDRGPEAFPPIVEITDSSSNERFFSRTVGIAQFRSPQTLVLSIFVGSQQPIPERSGRIVLNSSDDKLVVLSGSDYATFFLICIYFSIFLGIALLFSVFILWSRLRSCRNLVESLEATLAATSNRAAEKSK